MMAYNKVNEANTRTAMCYDNNIYDIIELMIKY